MLSDSTEGERERNFGFGNFHINQLTTGVNVWVKTKLKKEPKPESKKDFFFFNSNLTPAVDHQPMEFAPPTITNLIEDEHFTMFITAHRQETERYVSRALNINFVFLLLAS